MAKEIASIEIVNTSDLDDVSNYLAHVQERGEDRLGIPPTKKVVKVEGHSRRQSVFALLRTILNKIGN